MTDPGAAALRQVVRDHGRRALDDPDALRAALHVATCAAICSARRGCTSPASMTCPRFGPCTR
jgi:hypothetical protein